MSTSTYYTTTDLHALTLASAATIEIIATDGRTIDYGVLLATPTEDLHVIDHVNAWLDDHPDLADQVGYSVVERGSLLALQDALEHEVTRTAEYWPSPLLREEGFLLMQLAARTRRMRFAQALWRGRLTLADLDVMRTFVASGAPLVTADEDADEEEGLEWCVVWQTRRNDELKLAVAAHYSSPEAAASDIADWWHLDDDGFTAVRASVVHGSLLTARERAAVTTPLITTSIHDDSPE